MKPCPQCGTMVEPGTTFCPNCGFFLDWSDEHADEDAPEDENTPRLPGEEVTEELPPPPVEETLPLEATVTCPNCGETNEADRTFCRRCGTNLQAPPPPPPPPPDEPKEPFDRRRLVMILGGVAAVVLVIVLVVVLSNGDEPVAQTTLPPTTQTTPPTTTTTTPPVTTTFPPLGPPQDTADVIAARIDTPPTIDGNAEDWLGVTDRWLTTHAFFRQENWTGPEDLSAVWQLAWDDDYLYLLVETFDDVHVQDQTERLWEGDSVDVEFDIDLEGDASDPQVDLDDWQWILSPGNFGNVEPTFSLFRGDRDTVFKLPSLNAGLLELAATPKSPGGYVLEARIPWKRMMFEASAGATIGFSLSASDNDTAGTANQETMLSNDPDFRVAKPQTWGTLTLGS